MDAHCSLTVSADSDCDFWPFFLFGTGRARRPACTFHDGWTNSVRRRGDREGGWLLPWCQSGDPVMCLTNRDQFFHNVRLTVGLRSITNTGVDVLPISSNQLLDQRVAEAKARL